MNQMLMIWLLILLGPFLVQAPLALIVRRDFGPPSRRRSAVQYRPVTRIRAGGWVVAW